MIQVKDLRKSFKTMGVLKGVDFDVKRGKIFSLLGSNGAGVLEWLVFAGILVLFTLALTWLAVKS